MLDPLLIVELGLLGLCTGFLAGLLGIGGGMLLVPFLTYLLGARQVAPDLAVKMAIATSMATIVFTSVSSVRAHHKRGAVRWDIVTKLAPGIVLGGFVASLGVFALLKGSFLAVFFGLFVSFSAVQMFLDKKPAPTRQMPGTAGQLGAGGFIGFLSGLVGAGGGFVSVPFMTWCNVPIHNAVATSAALGFPIAVANVAGYIVAGQGVQELKTRKVCCKRVKSPARWASTANGVFTPAKSKPSIRPSCPQKRNSAGRNWYLTPTKPHCAKAGARSASRAK